MLESIIIKDIATYDSVGIKMNNLKKINFIYGANGSGKTTLSKYIHNSSNSIYATCNLEWKGGLTVNTLVYNKDFRDRNFGKGKIDGVFTLGEATKEEIEKIEKMQKDLAELKTKGIEKKASLDKQEQTKQQEDNEFKEIVWTDVYKENEDDFKDAFRGFIKKETFKDKILYEYDNNKDSLQTIEDLKEKAQTIFGKTPIALSIISSIDFEKLLEIETDKIWNKKIIGKADVEIAGLIQKLNLNDWVNEGKNYIIENDTCPFCQQKTITENFKKQLDDYFDETFIKDIVKLKDLSTEYNRISENIKNLLEQIETQEKEKTDTKLNIELFSPLLKTLISQLAANKELLNNKAKEPSRSITLTSTRKQLENIQETISNCNSDIKSHNDIVADYTNQRNNLINAIWKYLIEGHHGTIETFVKKQQGLSKGIDAIKKQHQDLKEKYTELNKKIREANKNVTSVQPSVDEINRILKSYGFLNFEIVPSQTEPNQYQILRQDGTTAESTLSEGEETFITFLYYLQLAKGSTQEDNITEERILVIDDPISSLDSNVLFVVSSLIKEIVKSIKKDLGSIKQMILLTHNVYFHKEVSFVDGRTPKNGDTNFWIVRKNNNLSSLQSYEMENPIQSSYELLWKELKNTQQNSGITIQNTMRRIIENYFKILGKYADDDLIKSFDNHQEQEICRSLVCWINDGSHGLPDDLYIEQQETILEKYLDVFKQIFVKMGHEEHYKMMYREQEGELAIVA
ncbi:AAA family ATPase [Flavobacterium aquicola]|uniref:Wobble nucleotide-excising tRNase n=1 Tax=Flavobacterium aquicola TaxID=1682742 RepID=A0A3E0E9V6_9FLAO|nr:AAA family ATPase [Flavobacterium aquicola]REG94039.1 wobble nucleotide-excising tRNase [Flavobacterium aquicola]